MRGLTGITVSTLALDDNHGKEGGDGQEQGAGITLVWSPEQVQRSGDRRCWSQFKYPFQTSPIKHYPLKDLRQILGKPAAFLMAML